MQLVWDDRQGIGYYPVDPAATPYDAGYFEKYQGYADTELGRRITQTRLALVTYFTAGDRELLDIGIGCGQFVSACRASGVQAFGFDVNPAGVDWLKAQNLYREPAAPVACMTFWDSFEHLPNPAGVVSQATGYVFLSIPIFTSRRHALGSKHFRTDEHYWYFTETGLIRFMRELGFQCLHAGREETILGREDIGTYAFSRMPPRPVSRAATA